MKHVLIILFFSSLIVSCHNTTAPSKFKKQAPDTVLTTIEYAHNWAYNDYRIVTAQRVALDTFTYTSVDSLTQLKKWIRDSLYFIQMLDTVRDVTGGVVKDSTGKGKLEMKVFNLPKKFILNDFNKNWTTPKP